MREESVRGIHVWEYSPLVRLGETVDSTDPEIGDWEVAVEVANAAVLMEREPLRCGNVEAAAVLTDGREPDSRFSDMVQWWLDVWNW